MANHIVRLEIDDGALPGYTDAFLATAWHAVQADDRPHDDKAAGEMAEEIGREIIRRWLGAVAPELWKHQGRSYYWTQLTRFALYQPGAKDPADPQWQRGEWVPKDTAAGSEPSGSGRG